MRVYLAGGSGAAGVGGAGVTVAADLARLRSVGSDPVEVGRAFLAYVAGEPDDTEMSVFASAEESARGRGEALHALPGAVSGAPEPAVQSEGSP